MDTEERKIFDVVIEKFKEQYPHRDIIIDKDTYPCNEVVKIDHLTRFNITGYNLLYNLKRLCDRLKDELI